MSESSNRTGRAAALEEIRRLASQHDLSAQEIASALAAPADPQRSVLQRVFAYLGGLFLFAGIAAFIALNWADFPSLARVGITFGVGVALFFAAIAVERANQWPAMVAPLLLAALFLEPTGMLVAFDEYGSGGDWRYAVLLTSLAVALQAGMTGLGLQRSAEPAQAQAGLVVLVFAAVLFGTSFWITLLDLCGVDENLSALTVGVALVLVGLGLDRQRYRWNRSAWPGIGSVFVFLALWNLVERAQYEMLFAVVAIADIYLSVLTRTRSLLVTGVAALLFYIGYFTAEHFADSLGWPLVLMVIGLAFVAVGYATLRFDRRYFRRGTRATG
ncbi:MAG: DUF2157 domain-containing protein [Pseudomonadota bacterium]